jgi:hypothetical protein
MVDDNFHYMDEDERYEYGVFSTPEEAIAACKKIVDEDLLGYCDNNPGINADKLYDLYVSFGDDPFIVASDPAGRVEFSAWDYAKEQSKTLGSASGLRDAKAGLPQEPMGGGPTVERFDAFAGGNITILGGESIYRQSLDVRRRNALKVLRPDEASLDGLKSEEERWLLTAMSQLTQIHQQRDKGQPGRSAFCIFEIDDAYVQFLAPPKERFLLCEAASAQSVSSLAGILNSDSERVLRELGFAPPGRSPNYSQQIGIETDDDLAYAARLAFRILRRVYRVQDFSKCDFKLRIPKG